MMLAKLKKLLRELEISACVDVFAVLQLHRRITAFSKRDFAFYSVSQKTHKPHLRAL
jgi:hypothetical protein